MYIGIVSLTVSVFSPFHSSWTQTLLAGVWNVHNFYETYTTSMKRGQLLWNVHNSFETCTTLVKRRTRLLTILYPYVCIYIYMIFENPIAIILQPCPCPSIHFRSWALAGRKGAGKTRGLQDGRAGTGASLDIRGRPHLQFLQIFTWKGWTNHALTI